MTIHPDELELYKKLEDIARQIDELNLVDDPVFIDLQRILNKITRVKRNKTLPVTLLKQFIHNHAKSEEEKLAYLRDLKALNDVIEHAYIVNDWFYETYTYDDESVDEMVDNLSSALEKLTNYPKGQTIE